MLSEPPEQLQRFQTSLAANYPPWSSGVSSSSSSSGSFIDDVSSKTGAPLKLLPSASTCSGGGPRYNTLLPQGQHPHQIMTPVMYHHPANTQRLYDNIGDQNQYYNKQISHNNCSQQQQQQPQHTPLYHNSTINSNSNVANQTAGPFLGSSLSHRANVTTSDQMSSIGRVTNERVRVKTIRVDAATNEYSVNGCGASVAVSRASRGNSTSGRAMTTARDGDDNGGVTKQRSTSLSSGGSGSVMTCRDVTFDEHDQQMMLQQQQQMQMACDDTEFDESGNALTGPGNSRYKTEPCRPFEETGICKYGEKCQFAHGPGELRPLPRHPKYKTEMCKTFHTVGICPYGYRCHFVHNESPRYGTPHDEYRPPPLAAAAPSSNTGMGSHSGGTPLRQQGATTLGGYQGPPVEGMPPTTGAGQFNLSIGVWDPTMTEVVGGERPGGNSRQHQQQQQTNAMYHSNGNHNGAMNNAGGVTGMGNGTCNNTTSGTTTSYPYNAAVAAYGAANGSSNVVQMPSNMGAGGPPLFHGADPRLAARVSSLCPSQPLPPLSVCPSGRMSSSYLVDGKVAYSSPPDAAGMGHHHSPHQQHQGCEGGLLMSASTGDSPFSSGRHSNSESPASYSPSLTLGSTTGEDDTGSSSGGCGCNDSGVFPSANSALSSASCGGGGQLPPMYDAVTIGKMMMEQQQQQYWMTSAGPRGEHQTGYQRADQMLWDRQAVMAEYVGGFGRPAPNEWHAGGQRQQQRPQQQQAGFRQDRLASVPGGVGYGWNGGRVDAGVPMPAAGANVTGTAFPFPPVLGAGGRSDLTDHLGQDRFTEIRHQQAGRKWSLPVGGSMIGSAFPPSNVVRDAHCGGATATTEDANSSINTTTTTVVDSLASDLDSSLVITNHEHNIAPANNTPPHHQHHHHSRQGDQTHNEQQRQQQQQQLYYSGQSQSLNPYAPEGATAFNNNPSLVGQNHAGMLGTPPSSSRSLLAPDTGSSCVFNSPSPQKFLGPALAAAAANDRLLDLVRPDGAGRVFGTPANNGGVGQHGARREDLTQGQQQVSGGGASKRLPIFSRLSSQGKGPE